MFDPAAPSRFHRQLQDRACQRAPGGVHSNVRLSGSRVVIDRGNGAWLWDVDGRDYVDYLLGQGPNFLGHAPNKIMEAVGAAVSGGMLYGGQHRLEIEAAEAVCEALQWPDMVRFGVSGTESVQGALRLARAATGRDRVVRFPGHYHGWLDNVLMAQRGDGRWGVASAGQLASHLTDFDVVAWNDPDALAQLLSDKGEEIAAVIMEPVMINAGVIEPQAGYLQRVRELCDKYSIVLIFDEVITGFRIARGGAAERYGVVPDLAAYGKALAGGWPVSALAGKAPLMELLGTGKVNHSGTFNASVMATAAVKATLTELRDDPPYERIVAHGDALMQGLRDIAQSYGVPLRVEGLPMAFHASFGCGEVTDFTTLQCLDLAGYAAFSKTLVTHGIWVATRGVWYVSTAHGNNELAAALERVDQALSEWVKNR